MTHIFLSLPIRRSLDGVSWASLSVQWIPTQEQRRQRIAEGEQLSLLDLPEPEQRPPLHPIGKRRYPVERLYSRLRRGKKTSWPGPLPRPANVGGFRCRATGSPAQPERAAH